MGKLSVFNSVTVEGYFSGKNGDISWSKEQTDEEFQEFVKENAESAGSEGMLLFGRITYELMESYWPTPQAMEDNPDVAKQMNNLPKIVFSKTMDKATWKNTRVVKKDIAAEVRKLKKEDKDMTLMGSGSIVSQLTQEGLVDEYQIVVNPVVIGEGRTMFDWIKKKLKLKLVKSRVFGNGNVWLCYEPAQ